MLSLGKKADDTKYTKEELATLSLDDVKKLIEVQEPGAFTKKVKKTTKAKNSTRKKTG